MGKQKVQIAVLSDEVGEHHDTLKLDREIRRWRPAPPDSGTSVAGSVATAADLVLPSKPGKSYITRDTVEMWVADDAGGYHGPFPVQGAATDAAIAAAVGGPGAARTAVDARADARAGVVAVSRSEAPISVMAHNPPTNGTSDATAALNDTAAAARAGQSLNLTTRGIYVPAHLTLYINGVVDLRYVIDVQLDGRILVGPQGLLILGHNSVQRPGQRIRLRDVRHAAAGQSNVCVRFVGLKQAQVTVGRCSRLELLADDSDPTTASLAYNTFYLGRIDTLHLRGLGPMGWITENTFVGGAVTDTLITGTYGHNQNTWVKTCVEGGTIDVQVGTRNRWIDARCEGGTQVSFGAGTSRNVIEDSFVSNTVTRVPGAVVVSDQGVDNAVIATPDLYLRPVDVARIDSLTAAFDSAFELAGQGIVPGLDMVQARGAWQHVLDTGIFPIREAVADAEGSTYQASWQMRRFTIASDAKWFRLSVILYNAAGEVITSAAGFQVIASGWALASGEYGTTTDRRVETFIITDPAATHARIRIRSSGTVVPFRWLRLIAFPQLPSTAAGADVLRRSLRQPLYQNAKPTQGLARPGDVVQGPSTSWRAIHRLDTTLTAAASSGATTVTVTTAAGLAAGDVVGVLLTNGLTHWTTIAGISGSTLTLTAGLAGAAAVGARVGTTRWS